MVPKRVTDRLVRSVAKFQQVLATAKDRDINESDTVFIIKDMLAEVFGYDRFLELTSEFAIRGTYCDLAIKIDNKVEFLIEAKAIGLELKDGHLRQVVDYGANQGIQWVILTNGMIWRIYRIRFEQPIAYDLVCSINFADLDPKDEEQMEMLFVICKEGLSKNSRQDFYEKFQTINRFVLGAFILNEEVINVLRRELRKLSNGVLVTSEEISKILVNEVLKRDVLEGDEATKAQARVRRFYGKTAKRLKEPASDKNLVENPSASTLDAPASTEPQTVPTPEAKASDTGAAKE